MSKVVKKPELASSSQSRVTPKFHFIVRSGVRTPSTVLRELLASPEDRLCHPTQPNQKANLYHD